MAAPRVFVSSTCYDLGEIRSGLHNFIDSYSYEPILSERGDIFYHPDLNTHDSCTNEINNCQLFILVIGGRFGGHYIADLQKSLVNAEYLAAKECSIPVFCFVKREVLEDHRLYEKNKSKVEVIKAIEFPSIAQQEYASNIFEFINEVRNSPVNNGLFPFEFGKDIEDLLRKQWAGMMFDFLLKRKQRNELEMTTALMDNLSLASEKAEELLEGIYRHLDKAKAEQSIAQIDKEMEAKKFFQKLFKTYNVNGFQNISLGELLNINSEQPWYSFLLQTGEFETDTVHSKEENKFIEIITKKNSNKGILIKGFITAKDKEYYDELEKLFYSFKELNKEQKTKVLDDFALPF